MENRVFYSVSQCRNNQVFGWDESLCNFATRHKQLERKIVLRGTFAFFESLSQVLGHRVSPPSPRLEPKQAVKGCLAGLSDSVRANPIARIDSFFFLPSYINLFTAWHPFSDLFAIRIYAYLLFQWIGDCVQSDSRDVVVFFYILWKINQKLMLMIYLY